MSQITWRKWHRGVGIVAALFIVLQALSGFMLQWEGSFGKAVTGGHEHDGEGGPVMNILALAHFGTLVPGAFYAFAAYRLLLALSLIFMAISGVWIWVLQRKALSRRPQPRPGSRH